MSKSKSDEIIEFYNRLGISHNKYSKNYDTDLYNFFRTPKNNKHLAWKPLKV